MSNLLDLNPAGMLLTTGYMVIKEVYKVTSDINSWIDNHMVEMKSSENPTISRTGRVLEGAKFGFGLGYVAPIVVITLGQYLCGFTLAAAKTAITVATLSNPIANTCAALGAIYFGWNALSDQEKAETIERLRQDLDVGAELIKSIANFVITKTSEILNSDNLKDLKEYISRCAHSFGKSLSDVTHAIKDKVIDTYQAAKVASNEIGDVVIEKTSGAIETAKSVSNDVSESIVKASTDLADSTTNLVNETVETLKTGINKAKKTISPKKQQNSQN